MTATSPLQSGTLTAWGSYLSDGSKLDGIEASADVTDATNVAAAGAIMDGDFTSNGLMKRTGAGGYTVDTNTYLTAHPTISGAAVTYAKIQEEHTSKT